MNGVYIAQALCFHGPPMQKIWEDERGIADLQQWSVSQNLDFDIYKERQRFFTFQDRAKRLKLHQFLARKCTNLYDKNLFSPGCVDEDMAWKKDKNFKRIISPYEIFIRNKENKKEYVQHILSKIKRGDVIYGMKNKAAYIEPLCTAVRTFRFLKGLNLKTNKHDEKFLAIHAQPATKAKQPRRFAQDDIICCEILDDSINGLLHVGISGTLTSDDTINLGISSLSKLPEEFHKLNDNATISFEEVMLSSKEWQIPYFDVLYNMNGLNSKENYSLMGYFQQIFPRDQYANALRQQQANKWAYNSLTDGITHFRSGNHVEAFQCLNQTLKLDPNNVEGLVARGALSANQGAFKGAITDFGNALKVNDKHPNARKYLCETMVALGHTYADEKKFEKALKLYNDVFQFIPNYPQAITALEELKVLMAKNQYFGVKKESINESIPGPSAPELNPYMSVGFGSKSNHSESFSMDGRGGSMDTNNYHPRYDREESLSPLSKRMLLHDATLKAQSGHPYAAPYFSVTNSSNGSQQEQAFMKPIEANEFKLDEDDTETRISRLLQEASEHKKHKHKPKKKKTKKWKKGSPTDSNEDDNLFKKSPEEEFELQAPKPPTITLLPSSSSSKTTISFGAHSYKNYGGPLSAIESDKLSKSHQQNNRPSEQEQNDSARKLSFQIRPTYKVDKFGLYRIASPFKEGSPTASGLQTREGRHADNRERRLRSRSRDGDMGRSRSRGRRRSRSRSLRRSNSYKRHRFTRSRSRSRSRSPMYRRYSRSRSRSRTFGRRRTPSPFVPRRTPSPRSRRAKTPIRQRSNDQTFNQKPGKPEFGNRIWKRPGYSPPKVNKSNSINAGRWLHDRYNEEDQRNAGEDDGPTIEEIDEIINKAQKERKEEIIKRDKNILKKPGNL